VAGVLRLKPGGTRRAAQDLGWLDFEIDGMLLYPVMRLIADAIGGRLTT